MTPEVSHWLAFGVLLVMAVVTLITRWGGVWLMSWVPIGARVRRFIGAMSSSVLVALLAPLAFKGDASVRLALLATLVTMALMKKPLPAIALGLVVAAAYRGLA